MTGKSLFAIGASVSLLLAGCVAFKDELHHPGGYIGSILDKHMLDASKSKRTQVLRAALVVAMLARSSTAYSHQGTESDNLVNAMVSASDQVNDLAGYVYAERTSPQDGGPSPSPSPDIACDAVGVPEPSALASPSPQPSTAPGASSSSAPSAAENCSTFSSYFESDVPQFEDSIFRLAVSALPQEAARNFLNDLQHNSALTAAFDALKLALSAIKGIHYAAAENRAGLEVQAAVANKGSGDAKCLTSAEATVADAMNCLGLNAGETSVSGLTMDDSPKSIAIMISVFQNIRNSCLLLPISYNNSATLALGNATDPTTQNEATLGSLKRNRIKLCYKIRFAPQARFPTLYQSLLSILSISDNAASTSASGAASMASSAATAASSH